MRPPRRCCDPKNYRYTPGRRPARAARGDRGEDAARLRPRGIAARRSSSPTAASRRLPGRSRRCSTRATRCSCRRPYWTTYPEAIKLAGGVPVEVFAGADQDYLVTVEQLEAARTERTKVLLFVSPSNPTGAVYSPEQTRAIGEWALEHGIWVDLRRDLPEPQSTTRPVAPVQARSRSSRRCPELADQTILVNGVAKTYAMTGWRLGWMVGPADAIKGAANLQSHLSLERVEHLAARRDRGADRPAGRRSRRCGRRSTAAAH